MHSVRLARKRSLGFGLIEIMVAMLIGLFGVLIMMQMLTVSEDQKRTTTGANDSMSEGMIALQYLQSEIRSSGYGITNPQLLGCTLNLTPTMAVPLVPVAINPLKPGTVNTPLITVGDANTDTLLVVSTNNFGMPEGDAVLGLGNNQMTTAAAFAKDDWIIDTPATRQANCTFNLEKVQTATPSTGIVTLATPRTLTQTDIIFNFGQSFRIMGYAVRTNPQNSYSTTLMKCDFTNVITNSNADCSNAANWTAVSNDIVSLRAQYGRDISPNPVTNVPTSSALQQIGMDGVLDVFDQVAYGTMCGWYRIPAVRLAVVARSAQMERNTVTAAPPVWDGSIADNPQGSTQTQILLTGNANWQYYRYRMFQTVVPVRNVATQTQNNQTSGC